MASSAEPLRALGALLTATEAALVATHLDDGDSLTSAAGALDPTRQRRVVELAEAAGLRFEPERLADVLRAIEGARSETRAVSTLWTMPGHVAQSGDLTTSLAGLVDGARTSVICSTFNFQETSQMWTALHHAARRPGVSLRIYLDASASEAGRGPNPQEVAARMAPAVVLKTRPFGGTRLTNHAKLLVVDHRIVVVTSANLSWSAEQRNIELGLRLDDSNLADRIVRELMDAEEHLYEVVRPGGQTLPAAPKDAP